MLESINKSGTAGEWRRWIVFVTFIFFFVLGSAVVILLVFGNKVFL